MFRLVCYLAFQSSFLCFFSNTDTVTVYELKSARIINAINDMPCVLTVSNIQNPDKAELVLCWRDDYGLFHPIDSDRSMVLWTGSECQEWIFFPNEIPTKNRQSLYLVPASRCSMKDNSLFSDNLANWNESNFFVRLKDENKDVYILKNFPSFSSVLHDLGFTIGERWIQIYGWFTACDFRVNGQWYSLSRPDFCSLSVSHPDYYYKGKLFERIILSVEGNSNKNIEINTAYDFFRGFSGFRMMRRFRVKGNIEKLGPDGLWLGGFAGDFPSFNTFHPSSYYYKGQWYDHVVHTFGSVPTQNHCISDVYYRPYVILFWDRFDVWLAILIDPQSSSTIFESPDFVFRGENFTSPSWQKATGPFTEGVLSAWYIIGNSDKATAVQRLERFYQLLSLTAMAEVYSISLKDMMCVSKSAPKSPPQADKKSVVQQKGKFENLEVQTPYCQFQWDSSEMKITSLRFDSQGTNNFSKDWLSGSSTGIYFSGASQWQRPLDWTNTSNHFYRIDKNSATTIRSYGNQLFIKNLDLRDPIDGQVFYHVDLTLTASETSPELLLKAEYETKIENNYPYLGWHFDFPKNTFTHFTTNNLIEDIQRWNYYRMGFKDLQPMRYVLNQQAFGAFSKYEDSPEALKFGFLIAETNIPNTACNLPNPLFDDPQGIQKVALTGTYLFWQYHNMAGIQQTVGRKQMITVYVKLEDKSKLQQIERNCFEIELPHAQDLSDQLNDFWVQHCRGGVDKIEGINSWWHAISNRFNPTLTFTRWKSDLKRHLQNPSQGDIKIGCGWIVPRGALPIRDERGKRAFDWNGGYIFEVNAHVLMSAEQYYLASGDIDFLKEMIGALENAAQFYLDLSDSEGTIILPSPFDGISGPTSCYWDGWVIGYQSAFIQMYAAGAFKSLARMEQELGRKHQSSKYEEWAQRFNKKLIDLFWREGDLTDNQNNPIPGGRLITWINRNGERIDAGFTDLNLMAIYLDLLPQEKCLKIFQWLDHDPHVYAWRDKINGNKVGILTFNTIDGNSDRVYVGKKGPLRYYAGPFNPFSNPPGMENGQVQYWVAGFDFINRIRFGMLEQVINNLQLFAARYSRGDLNCGHGVPESRPLPMFQGTSQMSPIDAPCGSDQSLAEDGMVYTLGIISGIFGIDHDYHGFYVRPNVPKIMRDAFVKNIRYRGYNISIKFHGYGNEVKKILVNGAEPSDYSYIVKGENATSSKTGASLQVEMFLNYE